MNFHSLFDDLPWPYQTTKRHTYFASAKDAKKEIPHALGLERAWTAGFTTARE